MQNVQIGSARREVSTIEASEIVLDQNENKIYLRSMQNKNGTDSSLESSKMENGADTKENTVDGRDDTGDSRTIIARDFIENDSESGLQSNIQ